MDRMDIDEDGEVIPGGQIVLPGDVLPPTIHLVPQENRPFFPGQAVPLLMNAKVWLPTFQAIKSHKQDIVGLIATKRATDGSPGPADLYDMGTVCKIHRIHHEDNQLQVLLEGMRRFRVRRWLSTELPLSANVQYFPDRRGDQDEDVKAYAVAIINTIKELIPLNPLYGEELKVFLARSNPNEPSVLADFAASLTSASKADLQDVLETVPLLRRLEKVVELLHRELQIAQAQMDIRQHVEREMQTHQREAFLKQQLKFIQQELGLSKDDRTAEIDEFKARIAELELSGTAQARVDEELKKLSLLEPGSAEFGVTRNYLDWLTSLPWGLVSVDSTDLDGARKTLNAGHEGLDDVKQRIVEFLALGMMKGEASGSIICLVGPPGVGKTSLGRSIAAALGRRFYRFSVGGMRDEAEIKGHRRTYIGAMPGKLIQALKDTHTANPVIMLDEVDKIGASYHGDPASALLEVLDPEQNGNFHDHYLDVDFDLSRVLFICTANQLDTIPRPLLDRMEIIHLSGYLAEEKFRIARKHLLPRQLKRAGLRRRGDVTVSAAALRRIIDGYARDAGVRRLDKSIATVIRKSVVRLLEGAQRPIKVGAEEVADLLGQPPFTEEPLQHGVGVVTGLAWTAMGGATLSIEATCVHTRNTGLKLTGQLGKVMQESANIAYSYLNANADELGLPADAFSNRYIHLHVPAGATPKDGPSAGITIACALMSLVTGRKVRRALAMTGELTLTGQVLPIGGVQEKLIAAKRQKIRTVILPAANRRDLSEVPDHVQAGLTLHFAERFDEVARAAFGS